MRKALYSNESDEATSSPAISHSSSNVKLQGVHKWPFSLKLPRGVAIRLDGPDEAAQKYILPASLDDVSSKISIKYQIVARVKKGVLSSGDKSVYETANDMF